MQSQSAQSAGGERRLPGHLLLIVGGATAAFWTAATFFEAHPVPTAAWVLVCLYLIARGIGFLYFAVPAVSHHLRRTVEIQQALPTPITVALAWELAQQDIFLPRNDWPDVPALLPLGGALATTRHHPGRRLRAAPPPRPHGMRFRRLTAPAA